jgi:hypothetical protein
LHESNQSGNAHLQAIATKNQNPPPPAGALDAAAAEQVSKDAKAAKEQETENKDTEQPREGDSEEAATGEAAKATSGTATPRVPGTMEADIVVVPCPKYEDLRQITTLDACAANFDDCATAEDLKSTRAKLDVLRSAGLQLVSSIASSVRELKNAVAQAKKQRELSDVASAKGGASGKKAQKPRAPSSGLEAMQTSGKPIEHYPLEKFPADAAEWIKGNSATNDVVPYIVTNVGWAKDLLTTKSPVAASAAAFIDDFKNSSLRDSTGRAMRKVADDENCDQVVMKDFLTTNMVPLQPSESIHIASLVGNDDKVKSVMDALALQNTAVKAGTVHVYVEKSNLWSARVGVQGTRSVAITCMTQLKDYMKTLGLSRMDPKSFFKDLRSDGISKYIAAGNSIVHATVGPGDFLFVPAHHIVLEYASGSEDVLCLRAAVLLARDKGGFARFKAEADLPTTPANSLCKAVLAQMST